MIGRVSHRIPRFVCVTGPLLVCWLALTAGCATTSEPVAFRFHPPKGLTYVQTYRLTRTVKMRESFTEVQETKTRVTVRNNGNGYALLFHPISDTVTSDGKPTSRSPLYQAMMTLDTSMQIDQNGKLVAVTGYDQLLPAYKRLLKKDRLAPSTVNTVLDAEKVAIAKVKAGWRNHVGTLAGQTAQIGEVWQRPTEVALPLIQVIIPVPSRVALLDRVTRNGVSCVRVQTKYCGTPSSLRKELQKRMEAEMDKKAGHNLQVEQIEITGEGERIVDPATLLAYSETQSQTTKLSLLTDDCGFGYTVEDKRELNYVYDAD